MEKRIETTYSGTDAQVGELKVNRLLPNRYIHTVGPFVFLDHLYPYTQKPQIPLTKDGSFAHPHRGIATFSYLFSGELEHYDSMGNYGIVKAGGAQWMKAGNGIIHDEGMSREFQENGGILHGLQFWVSLPAKNKAEQPEYFGLQSEDVPEIDLGNAGKLRVLIGGFEGKASPVPTYTQQFVYHVQLNPSSEFLLKTKQGLEYAAFLPQSQIEVNGSEYKKEELLVFAKEGTELLFSNRTDLPSDLILFGGEPYQENIVAEGPFVMNSRIEIANAYKDFFSGKYGKIKYQDIESVS